MDISDARRLKVLEDENAKPPSHEAACSGDHGGLDISRAQLSELSQEMIRHAQPQIYP